MNRKIITTALLTLVSATALCGSAMAADDSAGSTVRSRAEVEAEAVAAARQAAVSIDSKSRVAPDVKSSRNDADVRAEAVAAARQAAVSIDPKSRVAPSLR